MDISPGLLAARRAFSAAQEQPQSGFKAIELLSELPRAAMKLFETVPFDLDMSRLVDVVTDGRLTTVTSSVRGTPAYVPFAGGAQYQKPGQVGEEALLSYQELEDRRMNSFAAAPRGRRDEIVLEHVDCAAIKRNFLPELPDGPQPKHRGDVAAKQMRVCKETPEDQRYFPFLYASDAGQALEKDAPELERSVQAWPFSDQRALAKPAKNPRLFDFDFTRAALVSANGISPAALSALYSAEKSGLLRQKDEPAVPIKGSFFSLAQKQLADSATQETRLERAGVARKAASSQSRSIELQNKIHAQMTWLEACGQFLAQAHGIVSGIFTLKKLTFISLSPGFRIVAENLTTAQRKRSRIGHSMSMLLELCELLYQQYNLLQQFYTRARTAEETSAALYGFYTQLPWNTGLYRFKYRLSKDLGLIKHLRQTACRAPDELRRILSKSAIPYARIFHEALRGLTVLLRKYLENLLLRMTNQRPALQRTAVTKQRIQSYNDQLEKDRLIAQCLLALGAADKYQNRAMIVLHIREAWRLWRARGIEYSQLNNQDALRLINNYVKTKDARSAAAALDLRRQLYEQSSRLSKSQIVHSFQSIPRRFFAALREADENAILQLKRDTAARESVFKSIITAASMLQRKLRLPKRSLDEVIQSNRGQLIKSLLTILESQTKKLDAQGERNDDMRHLLFQLQQEPDSFFNDTLARLQQPPGYAEFQLFDKYAGIEIQLRSQAADFAADSLLSLVAQPPVTGLWAASVELPGVEALRVSQYLQEVLAEAHEQREPGKDGALPGFLWTERPSTFAKESVHFVTCPFVVVEKTLDAFMEGALAQQIVRRLRAKLLFKDAEFSPQGVVLQASPLFHTVFGMLQLCWEAVRFGVDNVVSSAGSLFLHARHRGRDVLYRRLGTVEYFFTVTGIGGSGKQGGWKDEQDEEEDAWQYNYQDVGACATETSSFLDLCDGRLYGRESALRENLENVRLSCDDFANVERLRKELQGAFESRAGSVWVFSPGISYRPAIAYNGYKLFLDSGLPSEVDGWKTQSERDKVFVCPTEAARWEARQEALRLIIQPPQQLARFSQRYNLVCLRFLQHFREFAGREALQEMEYVQRKAERFVQSRINSLDRRRICPAMLYLSEQFGGLGLFNLQEDGWSSLNEVSVQRYLTPWTQVKTQVEAMSAGSTAIGWWDLERIGIEIQSTVQGYRTMQQQTAFPVMKRGIYYFQLAGAFQTAAVQQSLKYGHLFALQAYHKDVLAAFAIQGQSVLRCTLYAAVCGQGDKQVASPEEEVELLCNMSAQIKLFEQSQLLRQGKLTKAQMHGLAQVPNRRFISFWSPLLNRSDIFIGKTARILSTGIETKGKLLTVRQFYTQLFAGHLWGAIHRGLVQDLQQLLARNQKELGFTSLSVLQQHQEKAEGVYEHIAAGQDVPADLLCEYRHSANERAGACIAVEALLVEQPTDSAVPACAVEEQRTSEAFSRVLIDVKLLWCNVDQAEPGRFLEHCRGDYQRDYSARCVEKPIRLCCDLVYQRQALLGPGEMLFYGGETRAMRPLAQFVFRSAAKLQAYCKPCQQFRLRLSNLLQVYSGQSAQYVTEENYGLLLRAQSLIFHSFDQRDEQKKVMRRHVFALSPQRLTLEGKTFVLPLSQRHKGEQFQAMAGEYVYQLLSGPRASVKAICGTQKTVLELLNKVTQVNNLPQSVYLSQVDFCLDQFTEDVPRALQTEAWELRFGAEQSADNFLRVVGLLRCRELLGADWTHKTLTQVKAGELGKVLGAYFTNKLRYGRNENPALQNVQWLDGQIQIALVENYCARFGFVERHLLRQRQIIKLILGGTVELEEVVQGPRQLEFGLARDTELRVLGTSRFHVAGFRQAAQRRINLLPQGSQEQWADYDIDADFGAVQLETQIDCKELLQRARDPIVPQSDEYDMIVVLPMSLIVQLRAAAPQRQTLFLYGLEKEDCVEVHVASCQEAEVISNTYKRVGRLEIGARAKGEASGEILLETDWKVAEIKGNASVVLTRKYAGELREWWDHGL